LVGSYDADPRRYFLDHGGNWYRIDPPEKIFKRPSTGARSMRGWRRSGDSLKAGKADMADRKPGVRIDGGKRRDLNKDRFAGRISALPKDAPTPEQIGARREAMETRARTERKAAKIGNEDAKADRIKVRDLQGQHARTLTQTLRCRPGTIEWRYGRNKQDVLFYAGSYLAQLWERAGMTVASPVDFLRVTRSGYITGIAEGRVAAIDKLEGFRDELGILRFRFDGSRDLR
jgi:hypothetical protein